MRLQACRLGVLARLHVGAELLHVCLAGPPTAATFTYAIWQSVDRSKKCSFMQAASLLPPGFTSPQTDLTSLAQPSV